MLMHICLYIVQWIILSSKPMLNNMHIVVIEKNIGWCSIALSFVVLKL